jgi:hypothetical protein
VKKLTDKPLAKEWLSKRDKSDVQYTLFDIAFGSMYTTKNGGT